MNHVFLSGICEKGAYLVSPNTEIPHAKMALTVTHYTSTGMEKKEQYPISAWRSTALRLAQLAKPGTRITIKGYLSQHLVGQTTMIEVTAEEFQVSGPFHHPSSPITNIPNEHKEEQHEK